MWGLIAQIAGPVLGALGQSDSSRKTANIQADAARGATALQKEQYDATVARNAPFVSGGTTAFNALLDRLGLSGNTTAAGYGSMGQIPTAANVMAEPGYEFGRAQGELGLNRQLNARGMSGSGAALKAAMRYNNDYASGQYGNAFNRSQSAQNQAYNQLSGVANMGQSSANNTAQSGANYATQAGSNMMGAANAQGANALAQGNIWGNLINQGASLYKNMPASGGSSMWSPGFDDVNATTGGWTGQH